MEPGPVIPGGSMFGEWGPALPNPPNAATKEIQEMVTTLKPELQKKLKMDFEEIQPQALFYNARYLCGGSHYLILVSVDFLSLNLRILSNLRMYLHTYTHTHTRTHAYAHASTHTQAML